jgi:hypothetical protein
MQNQRNDPAPAIPPVDSSKQPGPVEEPVTLAEFRVPCRHLRSKEMYYQDFGAPEDAYSSGIYWCGRTQESFGPDGHSCSQEECGGQRSCYLM